jgi:mitochondrial fission protein ELM1
VSHQPETAGVIWRLTDGKPGHENQSLGLVNALRELAPFQIYDIPIPPGPKGPFTLLRPGANLRGLPRPDLLIGAGHRTHLPLLMASWRYGGRSIVLMRPSLPLRWFDLCLIPEHDEPAPSDRVLLTQGALNSIRPSQEQRLDQGLILVGGPSRHFAWDNATVGTMVETVIQQNPTIHFQLTTSRRTPQSFLRDHLQINAHRLDVHPFAQTAPDWIAQALSRSGRAWVTADSVSMVYEALTAGCQVNILPLKQSAESRVARGLNQLVERHQVSLFDSDHSGPAELPLSAPLNEAQRCAEWIITHWLRSA